MRESEQKWWKSILLLKSQMNLKECSINPCTDHFYNNSFSVPTTDSFWPIRIVLQQPPVFQQFVCSGMRITFLTTHVILQQSPLLQQFVCSGMRITVWTTHVILQQSPLLQQFVCSPTTANSSITHTFFLQSSLCSTTHIIDQQPPLSISISLS
jgi:hypothetical protein